MQAPKPDAAAAHATPLPSPDELRDRHPATARAAWTTARARAVIRGALHGSDGDPRLVIVVGPCSLHDPAAALEYAKRLRELAEATSDALVIAMRTYLDKPRTTVGWKGLINDPDLDGRFDINRGLRIARGLLSTLAELDPFLAWAGRLLAPGGQILVDSGEALISEPPPGAPEWEWPEPPADGYPGEAWIRLEYRGEVGAPFRELYVDAETLAAHVERGGWRCEFAFTDEAGAYLARLRPPA